MRHALSREWLPVPFLTEVLLDARAVGQEALEDQVALVVLPYPAVKLELHLAAVDRNLAALDMVVDAEDLARLGEAFPPGAAAGARNPEGMMGALSR